MRLSACMIARMQAPIAVKLRRRMMGDLRDGAALEVEALHAGEGKELYRLEELVLQGGHLIMQQKGRRGRSCSAGQLACRWRP